MIKRLFNAKFCLVLFFLITSAYATEPPQIIQKPILFDAQRTALTQDYRLKHYGIKSKSIKIKPQMIVLHATASETFQSSFNTMYPPTIAGRPELSKFSQLNTSTQFLVGRDGTIYQLMPIKWMGRHVIGLNNIAIGIENVGGMDGKQDLTPAQLKANIQLVRFLAGKYPAIKYLIGHYEYGAFRNTPLWEEKIPGYFTSKVDPGPEFMEAVREQVKDLNLLSSYQGQ